jgi:Tfp pilus assembly protein PilF
MCLSRADLAQAKSHLRDACIVNPLSARAWMMRARLALRAPRYHPQKGMNT